MFCKLCEQLHIIAENSLLKFDFCRMHNKTDWLTDRPSAGPNFKYEMEVKSGHE
jgi:hypothetical protein